MMTREPWLKSQLHYGHALIHSAAEGARLSRTATAPVGKVLVRSARASLPWAAIGASVALLYSLRKQQSKRKRVLFGVLGAAVGLGTNVAFSGRQLTGEMVHGAVQSISAVRDAHWLANHPIDYA
jgi:hypothetical protein